MTERLTLSRLIASSGQSYRDSRDALLAEFCEMLIDSGFIEVQRQPLLNPNQQIMTLRLADLR